MFKVFLRYCFELPYFFFNLFPYKIRKKILKIKKIKKIDLLKLDTQGNEYLILKGAKKILAKGLINFIKLELIFEDYYTKSTKFYEIEKNFIKSNYKLISLEDLKYSADTKILQLDAIYKIK
jgi:hypothetical protein